jgi:hypothetical protein
VESGCWILQAAVVGSCRASNSTGVSMPRAEWRRWRLWNTSRYSKIAFAVWMATAAEGPERLRQGLNVGPTAVGACPSRRAIWQVGGRTACSSAPGSRTENEPGARRGRLGGCVRWERGIVCEDTTGQATVKPTSVKVRLPLTSDAWTSILYSTPTSRNSGGTVRLVSSGDSVTSKTRSGSSRVTMTS